MTRLLPALLLLAACTSGLPPLDGTISATARQQEYPELVPLDPLLAEGTRISRAEAAQATLAERGAALSNAQIPVPEAGDVAERGRILRERAARLRDLPV